jgi:hypothetical protein
MVPLVLEENPSSGLRLRGFLVLVFLCYTCRFSLPFFPINYKSPSSYVHKTVTYMEFVVNGNILPIHAQKDAHPIASFLSGAGRTIPKTPYCSPSKPFFNSSLERFHISISCCFKKSASTRFDFSSICSTIMWRFSDLSKRLTCSGSSL